MSGSAMNAVQQANLILDAEGTVLHIDEVAEQYLGGNADTFHKKDIRELFSGLVGENESVAIVAGKREGRRCTAHRSDRSEIAIDARIRRLGGGQDARFLLTIEPCFDVDIACSWAFVREVLDTVDASVAVVDAQGNIVYVNERWRVFSDENGGDQAATGVGQNYLRVCERATGPDSTEARSVFDALAGVLQGTQETFHFAYPCNSLSQSRWFQVRGRRFEYHGRMFAVLTHERIDELKQVAEALRLKQTRLEDAAALANLGYYERIMGDPRIVWSPEMARIMVGDPSQTRPEQGIFYDILHPDDRERVRVLGERAIEEKCWFDTEYRIVRSDGEVRWIHSTARPVLGKSGEIERFFGVLQDITPYKQAIAEIERNQAQFRTMFELANDGIAIVDLAGKILLVNARLGAIAGVPIEGMIGRNVFDFLHPSSVPASQARFRARLAGESLEPVVTVLLPDGSHRTLLTSVRTTFDEQGIATGAHVFVTDLTASVATQKTLDLTLARFQRALEMTHTLVSDQDAQLRFVRVYNGHFYRDPIGRRDDELLPIEYAERIVRIKQGVLDTGKPAREDVTVLRGDEFSHFDLCVEPILDENNRTTGITCVAVDITERVNAQVARLEHNERVRAELEAQNKALEAARLEADQANAAKSQFLAMMSHEIRTPLNGVLGMAAVLLDSMTDSTQRDIVETIRTSGDALLMIINDILDFSKIEAGLMDLEEQPFVLRHCLDDVIDLIGPLARKKSIELGFMVDSDVPVGIWGDITRLRQILVNLVGNALKFTEAGEVVVEVKLGKPTPNGKLLLHFTVRDTGIGIAAERLARLFQTFSQVDASINRKYGGTGLGLAICKRLVELMGGRIWVESTPRVGTTFQFTIPTMSAPGVKSELLEAIATARWDLEGKHVLIVDDNPTTRSILARQIQSFGLVPIAASSGEQALAILLETLGNGDSDIQTTFLLALLDLEMPGMNGFQLAATIREHVRLTELPLLFVTASNVGTTAVTSQWRVPCLSKPVKQSTLFDGVMRISQHISPRSSHAPRSIPIDTTLGRRFPLRILLAEDNAINQKVALLLLQRAGYRADVAANGQEVLDAVSTKTYDLILMDVQMPEMDGLEATRRLRGPGPWLGKPRIVAVTADVMQEGKEACIAAGMDDFVAKPIRINELMRLLERNAMQQAKEPASEEAWLAGTEAQLLADDEMLLDEGAFAALRSVCALEGEGALAQLVKEFLADSRRMLDDLLGMSTMAEYAAMERLAHTLKGTSATFGAKSLSRRMAELEEAVRDRKSMLFEDLIRVAIAEHGRVSETLLARSSIVSPQT